MMFENLPYPDDKSSFLKQQDVLDYLAKYAEGLSIKLNHKVYLVSRVADYSGLPDCIIQHSAHVSEITEDGVKTTDGKELKEIDTIISCLNLVAITFPLFECQVRMALAFALEKTPLPSQDELEKYEEAWMERQRQRDLGLDRFHKLSSQQWPYFHEINSYAIRPYKLEYIKLLSELYTYCWNDKKKSSLDFKGVNFNVDYENYTFTVEQKNR
ncbi:hypothetical protein WR25_26865 [Diploscapter pachys]|uniref:Uncharacterized protein n=1 Tax=Diploscapter pachys TaxID=2018661 RepID=A0A2A2KTU6_9BILA|nr:hypothetical protein WR25_26865 [Diploscapter pachys]